MGGDEFCVLTAVPSVQHAELAAVTRAALSEHGDGVAITASLGTAAIDRPDGDWDDALRDADRRMYAEKNGLRGSAGGQSAAVLLRVLTERHPDLSEHVDSVAALTAQVGLELGMTEEDERCYGTLPRFTTSERPPFPTRSSTSPGRSTTTNGPSCAATPSSENGSSTVLPRSRAPARLVRSSHESFGGGGYPDQLAGAGIPLGARIIAVCDAYDAMVSNRPYRHAMPSEQAMQELSRCAGTQFDPVVDAFVIALAHPALDEATRGPVPIPPEARTARHLVLSHAGRVAPKLVDHHQRGRARARRR